MSIRQSMRRAKGTGVRPSWLPQRGTVLAVLLFGALAVAAHGQVVTQYPVLPNALSRPEGIVTGPDGNLWFCEESGNRIGRMTPAGAITEFTIPTAASAPEAIVVGPDGNLWFTELTGNQIGRITTSGIITEFPIPTAGSQPEGIAAGPDGNLWFSETLGNKIGRITTDGVITEFPLPTGGSRPEGLSAGPDGAVWFVENNGNRIGRITAQGVINEFTIPTANSEPWNITLGADGNLWFSEGNADQIGRITPAGVITEFPIPTAGGTPDYITAGPDGNVWFSEFYGNRVGRITMEGDVTEFILPAPTSHPYGITSGPDGAIWFCLEDENRIGRITTGPAIPNPMEVDARTVTGTSSNANGVFESGETVQVDPTWTNTLVASSDLTGAASAFDGAGSASYTIDDATADYGTVPAESSASCEDATGDCYLFTITGSRPAPHWDASFTETVSPDAIEKSWTVHVGESFPDVPTSHQFYAFIETLFHSGVTGGCGLGNYCPANSVTRGQMAVFLLKGKLGTQMTVPPATGTVFNDVPASHPFAAWIEALAGFQITGGCGSGNYCPDNPVTRAQMAVFLLKAKHGSAYLPPLCTPGYFDDVPCPSQFAAWIQQLAEEEITGGCGGNNYCPNNPITRGQMAVFLVKTFGLQLYGL